MESEQEESDFYEYNKYKYLKEKVWTNRKDFALIKSEKQISSKSKFSKPWKESPQVSNRFIKSNNLKENKFMSKEDSKTINIKGESNLPEGSSVQNDELNGSSSKLVKVNKDKNSNNITSFEKCMNGWSFGQTWKEDQDEFTLENSRPSKIKIKVENRVIKIIKDEGFEEVRHIPRQKSEDKICDYNLQNYDDRNYSYKSEDQILKSEHKHTVLLNNWNY